MVVDVMVAHCTDSMAKWMDGWMHRFASYTRWIVRTRRRSVFHAEEERIQNHKKEQSPHTQWREEQSEKDALNGIKSDPSDSQPFRRFNRRQSHSECSIECAHFLVFFYLSSFSFTSSFTHITSPFKWPL
jgi:hypothetical protein